MRSLITNSAALVGPPNSAVSGGSVNGPLQPRPEGARLRTVVGRFERSLIGERTKHIKANLWRNLARRAEAGEVT